MAGTPEQVAFEAAWFEPRTNKIILKLSRTYAHPPVDADDLYHQTFLKLWSSPKPPVAGRVVWEAQETMRHFRTTHFRRKEQQTTDRGADVEEVEPISKPGSAEERMVVSQSVVRLRAILETKLRGTAGGDRALALIDAKLDDVEKATELMDRLGATRTQIYEATRLAKSTLEAVLAAEEKVVARA